MRKEGCEKFNTSIVNHEEYLLLAETMERNGSDLKRIIDDISFIDDCLTMRRMVMTIGKTKTITYTKNGNLRWNRNYSDFIMNRLNTIL